MYLCHVYRKNRSVNCVDNQHPEVYWILVLRYKSLGLGVTCVSQQFFDFRIRPSSMASKSRWIEKVTRRRFSLWLLISCAICGLPPSTEQSHSRNLQGHRCSQEMWTPDIILRLEHVSFIELFLLSTTPFTNRPASCGLAKSETSLSDSSLNSLFPNCVMWVKYGTVKPSSEVRSNVWTNRCSVVWRLTINRLSKRKSSSPLRSQGNYTDTGTVCACSIAGRLTEVGVFTFMQL